MTDVHLNTRRTLADLGMRDTGRNLFYGCAIRGFVHADNAHLLGSSPSPESQVGRSSRVGFPQVYNSRGWLSQGLSSVKS